MCGLSLGMHVDFQNREDIDAGRIDSCHSDPSGGSGLCVYFLDTVKILVTYLGISGLYFTQVPIACSLLKSHENIHKIADIHLSPKHAQYFSG